MTDYLPHDGFRPSLALRTDGLRDLRALADGDMGMHSGDIETALPALVSAVETVTRAGAIPVVLGGDHSIAFADATGVANVPGHGRGVDAALRRARDTGDIEFGSLWGHGQPMRRLIESGALRGIPRSPCSPTARPRAHPWTRLRRPGRPFRRRPSAGCPRHRSA
jgi:agmatinase